MIQETLDYLLTRSFLACCSSEQIIESIDSKETFSYFVKNIVKIMEQENFIFTSQELINRVADTIYKYRFDYNKDKEINNNMNYIIDRIKDYKEMSNNRKRYIQEYWVEEECKNRSLPNKYKNIETLLEMVIYDSSYVYNILAAEIFYIENLAQYVSIINFVLNELNDDLEEDISFLEVSLENLKLLEQAKLKRSERKMLESTIRKLEDVCTKKKGTEENDTKTLKKTNF